MKLTYPHLAVDKPRKRYDLGDEIARRHGVWVVITACGREVDTTLTTRRSDLVRCPDCRGAAGDGAGKVTTE